jgi:hypothetical protein
VLAALAFVASLIVGCGGSEGSDGAASGDAASSDGSSDGGDGAPATTAAPENLFDTDFVPACDGVGVPQATAYDAAAGVIHPVVVLAGGNAGDLYGRIGAVSEAWTRQWTQEAPLAMAEIELVVCAERQSSTVIEECTGYEVDGVATGNVVRLHEAVYAVSLRAAATGAEIASTTITAREDCPMFVSFSEGETSTDHYSFDDDAIAVWVKPFVAPV